MNALPASRTTPTPSRTSSSSSTTTTSATISTSWSECAWPYMWPHTVHPEEYLGVYAIDTLLEPFRKARRSYFLFADGRWNLCALCWDRQKQLGNRKNHKYLPEVRISKKLRQRVNCLQQPCQQYLQLHDWDGLNLKSNWAFIKNLLHICDKKVSPAKKEQR